MGVVGLKLRVFVFNPRLTWTIVIDKSELGAFLDPDGEKVAFSASDSPRAIFYSFMVQE